MTSASEVWCTRCRRSLPAEEFYPSSRKESGDWCKACRREYYRQPKQREQIKRSFQRRSQSNRAWLWKLKEGLACEKCGEGRAICLDFHHRDGKQKTFQIADLGGRSRKQILDEIAKCDVLCANCHRVAHADDLGEEYR